MMVTNKDFADHSLAVILATQMKIGAQREVARAGGDVRRGAGRMRAGRSHFQTTYTLLT